MGLEVTRDEMGEVAAAVRRATSEAHRKTALELWGRLRDNSPQDHGRLAGSWSLDLGQTSSTVGTAVEYALYQNEGTSPYDIYPKNANALRFSIGGSVVYATHVRHPGVEGKHFVEQSINEAEGRIEQFVNDALSAEGLV